MFDFKVFTDLVAGEGIEPPTFRLGLIEGIEPSHDISPQINLLPTAFTLWLYKPIRHSESICIEPDELPLLYPAILSE